MSKETLKAQAQGRNGEIDFDIEIENREIADIKVTKSSETKAVFNQRPSASSATTFWLPTASTLTLFPGQPS